jgi:hypothetical protein
MFRALIGSTGVLAVSDAEEIQRHSRTTAKGALPKPAGFTPSKSGGAKGRPINSGKIRPARAADLRCSRSCALYALA